MEQNNSYINSFLGRETEFGVLKNITAEAKAGHANSIFLSGRRGVGKTEFLKKLYSYFFANQSDVIPFLYTVKSAVTSVERFSRDYLSHFILQSFAFLKRDRSLMMTGVQSPEHLKSLAKEANAQWAIEALDNFMGLQQDNDVVNLFLCAISAPYQSYASTGMPLVVMIDDFDKIRNICGLYEGADRDSLWMLYENYLQSWHTPHIISGFYSDLRKMFFEETSIGERLDMISLAGLTRDDSADLFSTLCSKYRLEVESPLTVNLDLFDGNPFYIRSFVQAVRQANITISEHNFWDVYVHEVTRGKIYLYWMSLLKSHVTQFEMRKPSLEFLETLYINEANVVLERLSEKLGIHRSDLEMIIDQLTSSGAVETGFSTLELSGDTVLMDVIKGLYHKEILREPYDTVKGVIIADKMRAVKADRTPSFDITIPPDKDAELVAVRSLEAIARHYHVRPETTGQLQIALIELFSGILAVNGYTGSFLLKFRLLDDTFMIEIDSRQRDLDMSSDSHRKSLNLITSYVDEINDQKTVNGCRITLRKVIQKAADA